MREYSITTDIILESKSNKNLHLEHLEDYPLNDGYKGITKTVSFLNSVFDLLKGNSELNVDVTVKYDGAPAIFCGTDPSDGKFFVGTKSVFSKSSKLVKSLSDISKYGYPAGLADKLKVAFTELSKIGIKNVLQGDMMFTSSDIQKKKINGIPHIMFQPNTIIYAVPEKSELGKKIMSSKIGIVFHTTYSGDSLETMEASFGANVSQLKKVSSVWFDDAYYKDVTGFLFSGSETDEVSKKIKELERLGNSIGKKSMSNIFEIQNQFKSNEMGAGIKTFFNSKIRSGSLPEANLKSLKEYFSHFENHFRNKIISKLKTDKAKAQKLERMNSLLTLMKRETSALVKLLKFMKLTIQIKNMLIRKLEKNSSKGLGTFVIDNKGFRVTTPEGFVAIDRTSGGAVKFVDRLEFSRLNFTVDKNWSKASI